MKFLQFLQKILTWFSGKKTIIGSLGLAFLGLDLSFMDKVPVDIITILYWIFGIMTGLGLSHKTIKAVKKGKS